MNISTTDVKKKFDLHHQYDVFLPWLHENGVSMRDLPVTAQTETGETVIVEVNGRDDDGHWIWRISTLQENGWIRVNNYYYDGTVDEMFEK